jgi:3,4-dihydroxy 2-butanone 4-phosphate synthase/GTP cyclohydrolase II
MTFNTIEESVEDIKNGKIIVVVDDENREPKGYLLIATEKAAPEAINFMETYGRGPICMPVIDRILKHPAVGVIVTDNTDAHCMALDFSPEDLCHQKHVFPLRYSEGNVLRRAEYTEAAVDLAKLAGLYPAGVVCEMINEDGTKFCVSQLLNFAKKHNLKIITIADLINYSKKHERFVTRIAEANLPTKHGIFKINAYESSMDNQCHVALVKGNIEGKQDVLVRVHSECLTGDALGSLRCDCGEQLDNALYLIEKEGTGVLLYMHQEGRGIGLANKIKAYALQDKGKDTVEANEILGFPADLRDYDICAQILVDLGLTSIRLLTNNPRKLVGLNGYGLKIKERVPLEIVSNKYNHCYLLTKKLKLGHLLDTPHA